MEFSGTVLETGNDVSTVNKVNWLKPQTVCSCENVLIWFTPISLLLALAMCHVTKGTQDRRQRTNSE